MRGLLNKLLDFNARELKKLQKIVDRVNGLESEVQQLSDEQLKAKTLEFKQRLERGASLDDILPETFAVVRETARRTVGMRPFDVQVLGGVVLHQGRIAEMKTGEGKTLVATMPAYLNALTGKGVHVVTVNDYLARRDSEWMGQIYRFLGLEVGLIVHGLSSSERYRAYRADITYGTNNEFGFDYLRDNMAVDLNSVVQRPLHYAIIDEVDSILIDEARTPLIISGSSNKSTDMYKTFINIARSLKPGVDYTVDEKARTATPTEVGLAKVEEYLGVNNLFEEGHMELNHYLEVSLKALALYKRDRDYIVKDGQVIIVDEFTGRLMFGRRYSDGLHQAIEAKEGVKVAQESQTLATITIQNYFRMYEKLAGMTGTAKTEEEEFSTIYGMDVVVVPTNKPMIRQDLPDVVYKTEAAKFKAVVDEICRRHAKGQPVLVGTVSIEKSEMLSEMLKRKGIPHRVLNAKYHEQEAEIIKEAGQKGKVTIATNMAGRGTDIVLGEGVVELGGLHVLGTERHESRRIDNQLRGRSGRQGDPGSSQFFISLEDDLMRLFAADTISAIMDKLGLEDDVPIEHPLLTRAIERAQKKVEARNFNIRKAVLEYDNVVNKQREVIYAERRKVLEGTDLKEQVIAMIADLLAKWMDLYIPYGSYPEDWDVAGLAKHLQEFIPLGSEIDPESWRLLSREELLQEIERLALEAYERREEEIGSDLMRQLERMVMLRVVDRRWIDHIDAMADLRQGIGLRAYGGSNPLLEYQKEAYDMFNALIEGIKEDVVKYVFRVQVVREPSPQARPITPPKKPQPVRRKKIGRNDPCPCGSGKKYKKCCGR